MTDSQFADTIVNTYILLLRHGSVHREPEEKEDFLGRLFGASTRDEPRFVEPRAQSLSKEGRQQAGEVANRLAEVLSELPEDGEIRVDKIWRGEYTHVVETADIFAKILREAGHFTGMPENRSELNPANFGPYDPNGKAHIEFAECLGKELDRLVGAADTTLGDGQDDSSISDMVTSDNVEPDQDATEPKNAILVVGHQPFLDWLASEMLGKSLPIARSELVCLRGEPKLIKKWPRHGDGPIRRRWALLWSIEPTDEELAGQLREKIRSKMDVAKVLGGLVSLLFGLLARTVIDAEGFSNLSSCQQISLTFGLMLLILSIGLYLLTMYAYDLLLMPTRFWADRPRGRSRSKWLVWRPPSSSNKVLYQNMIRIWNNLFRPATVSVMAALLLLGATAISPNCRSYVYSLVAAVALALLLWLLYLAFQPRLGVED